MACSHDCVAHGVVPWAMSPSTVSDPVDARRPTARSCIGERSCASSSTTCPRLGVRSSRSATSSSSAMSARDQRAAPLERGEFSHSNIPCSGGEDAVRRGGERHGIREQPEEHGGRVERRPQAAHAGRHRSGPGHGVLHPVVRGVTGALELEQHAVRQPLRQQVTGRGVAHAPGDQRVELVLDLVGRRRASAATRGGPPAPRRPGATCAQTARCSTSARRASPLSIATSVRSWPPAPGRARAGCRSWRGRPGPRPGRAAPLRCGRGRRGSGRPPARPSGRAGRGRSRAARRRGAGRRRSCRCRARPARRCWCRCRCGRSRPARAGWSTTMSRIGPLRGRSISAARMPLGPVASPAREALVLVRREAAPVDAEAAAQLDAHRVGGGGPVERGARWAPASRRRPGRRGRRTRAGARCGRSRRRGRCGCRSGRRTRWCAGRPAARRPGGPARGRAARWSRRRWPWRHPAGRCSRASGAARRGRGRGGPAPERGRRRWWWSSRWMVSAVGAGTADPPLGLWVVSILANR